MKVLLPDEQRQFLLLLAELATRMSLRVYCVGGYVRDIFLGRPGDVPDIDCVLEENVEQFALQAAQLTQGTLCKYEAFYTFKIKSPELFPFLKEFDIATARKETYARPGALPTVTPASMADDLSRRDFTVNAMALPIDAFTQGSTEGADLEEVVLDPFDGRTDLQQRRIRVLHPASFTDDPTRIFRACRYAARIRAAMDSQTAAYARTALANGALDTVSWFRLLSEIKKLLNEETAADGFDELEKLGGMARVPFVPLTGRHEFSKRVKLLTRIGPPICSRSFGAFLRLVVLHGNEETVAMLFKSAGLSRAERAAVLSDVDAIRRGEPGASLSESGRITASLLD